MSTGLKTELRDEVADMKGLIIKDLYCLKKQFIMFAFIITGVVAVAIMFVLSERFGNLREAVSGMTEAGLDIASIVKFSVMFFMLLPLVCTGNIADSFTDDKTASFYKTAASLPISTEKRVLSKFVTAVLFLAVGLAVDVAMAAVISSVSDIILFSKCAGTLISLSACMLIFMSCVILLNYAGVPSMYSTFIPLGAAGVLILALKIKDIVNALINDDFSSIARTFRAFISALESRPHIFMLAAAAAAVVCWFASVWLAERKRGVA